MQKKIIPIVFALNDDFALFGYVACYTLIKHADQSYKYKIHIFETNLNRQNQEMLTSLSNDYVDICCIDVAERVADIPLRESLHLSVETYYRLFAPLFLQQYEKILYLDSDICVLSDVSKLFFCDLRDYPAGAVRDVPCHYLKMHSMEIGGLDVRKTFNAGVFLINTKIFEEEHIRDKCISLLLKDEKLSARKFIYADQDLLNVVLYNNVHFLSDAWNVQTQYASRLGELEDEYIERYSEALRQIKIVHYSGDHKPWLYPKEPWAEIFWDFAMEAGVEKDVLYAVIEAQKNRALRSDCFCNFQFPYERVPYGGRVVIYGAGVVGSTFINQIRQTKYCQVVLLIDRAADTFAGREICGEKVLGIKEVLVTEYDAVIVAIENNKYAKDAQIALEMLGVPRSKIVWDEYRKRNNR